MNASARDVLPPEDIDAAALEFIAELYAELGEPVPDLAAPDTETHKAWRSDDHPRGDDGRFIDAHDLHEATTNPAKAKELREKVTKPDERAKLDAAIDGGEEKPADEKPVRRDPALPPDLATHAQPHEVAAFHEHLKRFEGTEEYDAQHAALSQFMGGMMRARADTASPAAGGEEKPWELPKPREGETRSEYLKRTEKPRSENVRTPQSPRAKLPAPTGDHLDASEKELRALVERNSKEPSRDSHDADTDALLSKVQARHTPEELHELSRRVYGKRGRKKDGSDAVANLRTDLTAVKRLLESQKV